MPRVTMFPEDYTVISTATVFGEVVPTGATNADGARIRRYGGDPALFSRDGTLFDTAVFTTIDVPMAALTEVFGLFLRAVWLRSGHDAESTVGLQISVDGGVTYQAWTGVAWEVQTVDEVFNSRAEMTEHLATLALQNPRQVGFRIKLDRGGVEDTPMLLMLGAYVEWSYDERTDLHRTLRDLFARLMRVPTHVAFRLDAASAAVTLGAEAPADATKPIRVFNLTADPLKNTDLFASYNAGTRVVTMTAAQALSARIEVHYSAIVPVHIVRPDEMVELSAVPAVLVSVADNNSDRTGMTGEIYDYRIGTDTARVRVRFHPVVRTAMVTATLFTPLPESATAISQVLRKVLSSRFRFLATGETPEVIEQSPGHLDDIKRESIFVGGWSGLIRYYVHSSDFREYPGMKRLDLNMGAMQVPWPSDHFRVTR